MASAEQIRRAMEAEAPPDDVEYRAPPVVDVADDESEAPAGVAPRADADDESEPAIAGWAEERLRAVMGAAVDEWLSIADWDYQRWKEFYSSRTILHQIPRTPLLFEVCIELVCSPGNDQKTLQRGAAGLFALYTFYKTQTGRQQKAVMDIDQFEWFFALQDAARGAPGHRGAHDVQVIFKMLFDDQGVDVALRRRAPQMPPIEEPWPGGLDLRDVAEASRNYDAVRPSPAGSLVADLKRLCARFNGAAPAAAIIEAPAPAPAPAAAPAPPPGRYDRLMALDDLGEASDEDMAPPPPQRRPPPPIRAPPPKRHADEARVVAAVRAALNGGGDATAAARAVLEAARPRPSPPTAPANGLQQLRDMMNESDDDAVLNAARPRPPPPTAPANGLQQLRDMMNQPRPPMMAPPPPQCAPMAPPQPTYAPPPPRRTAGPDNGLQQLRDLLARSDDDDSVPEIPGTTI